jgi:uncharacterized protein (DUF1501 family)
MDEPLKEKAMQRRESLKWLGALPLAGALGMSGRVLAAPGAPSKLLFVFLRGGYDAASLLVPTSSDFYYQVRPNIAIPRPGAANGALALDADWGLHPALKDSIYPLFSAKQAAFVPFAGTDDLTRSHFETQDTIEMGQGNGNGVRRDYRSGFMNRLAAVLGGQPVAGGGSASSLVRPIAFTDQLPLILQGGVDVPNIALRNVGKGGVDERQSRMIAAMYGGQPLDRQVKEGFTTRSEVVRKIEQERTAEMDAASRNAINARGFELEARRVATLMRDKYQLGFIDVGGWDTHVGQGASTGNLATRLDELGRGLATFARTMGPDWDKTVVVVASEFGRTFRENGNRGTDHGHGTVFWVLGGGVKGGIAGEQVAVKQATLFQNRDYPVLNEYRAVLGGLFARMYGLDANQLAKVFPGVTPKDIGLV